jgi:glutathione S-transferase
MELWHALTCPYCQRVRIALAEKHIEVEEHVIDLRQRPPELLSLNPAGGVPVLVVDGTALPESRVILEYLEDRDPERRLFPRDPVQRARVRLLYDRIESSVGPHLPKLLRGSEEEREDARRAIAAALEVLERGASEEGQLAGPFSNADIALATFVRKLPESSRPAALSLPRLARWETAVMSRPSVAAVLGTPG